MKKAVLTGLLLAMCLALGGKVRAAPLQSPPVYPEGRDYATEVLGDGWDMQQFSDVSQRLDYSDQLQASTIQVQNGVFSATSLAPNEGSFFPLYPGYQNAMQTRKAGSLNPIPSSTYHCLWMAMNMQNGSGGAQVRWFDSQDTSPNNYKNPIVFPNGTWSLQGLDLSGSVPPTTGLTWTTKNWLGLQIVAAPYPGPYSFQVAWIRLTDCTPIDYPVTWSGSGSATIFIRPQGTTREIQVTSGQSGGTYNLDLEGIPPGVYDTIVRISSQADQVVSPAFDINAAPIASFIKPSMASGADYATLAGNPWDFSDTSFDVASASCVTWSVSGGMLKLDTPPLKDQTGPCAGTNNDPQFYLNMPVPIPTIGDYRYLSFKMNTDNSVWPVQTVPDGMIVRWIWAQDKSPYDPCYQVSHDIPYDVGWWITGIDLHDPYNGMAEQATKGTPSDPITCNPMRWTDPQPSVIRLRFDPNENSTGSPGAFEPWVPAYHFIQQIDWIRLTKEDSAKRGAAFPLRISLNKPAAGMTLNWYYTSDLASPKQHVALEAIPVTPSGPNLLYLPLITNNPIDNNWYLDPIPYGASLQWDTSGVALGAYYACVEANDGLNSAVYCSDAPVQITGP